MVILNGRCLGDFQGSTTFYQYNGSSLVDYGLCNNNIFKDIRYFCVGQPNHLSDHAFITCSIETNNSCNLEKLECIVTSPFPNGFHQCTY